MKLKEIGEFNRFVNDLNERDENKWYRNAMTGNDAKLIIGIQPREMIRYQQLSIISSV